MKIQTKEIYKCEHCNKLYQIKSFCANHELVCTKNPENQRACWGCRYLQKKLTKVVFDSPLGGEGEREVSILYCDKKEIFLYPPKVEVKRNMYEFDGNEPMPKLCSERKEYYDDGYQF